MTEPLSPAQQRIGDLAPKLVEITDDVLYGQVWERPELSKRDRSLITVASLIAMNRLPQLKSHMRRGLAHGLTREEIAETITHLAFYAGWPCAMGAIDVLKDLDA
ncbi:carboxymuconolactone decarboxylase family protein [Microbacterium sp. X-17]|uniref:carboxymuconolactone decarboxylase family protein n=1 Tax=Microbacterium sp. X-17 TaxID=3144404 RepID=UPI0031F53FD4